MEAQDRKNQKNAKYGKNSWKGKKIKKSKKTKNQRIVDFKDLKCNYVYRNKFVGKNQKNNSHIL